MNKIFVYGTLRKDQYNHAVLRHPATSFIGKGKTVESFAMYGTNIPFVNRIKPKYQIIGELYEVSDDKLADLDWFEGHPDWYKREVIAVVLDDGTLHEASIYLNDKYSSDLMETGDYAENIKKIRKNQVETSNS